MKATVKLTALVIWLFELSATVAALAAPTHDQKQESRWGSAYVQPHRYHEVTVICDRIQRNWSRYTTVATRANVPPEVIAGLHNMEASGEFTKHLHEGSPLSGRTKYVPVGRPKFGSPPFKWEDSAVDALEYDKMSTKAWTVLGPRLTAVEDYNGSGYRRYHPETPTPYLWAGTTVERPGKYVADGRWSSTARSKQIGVAAIWKELEKRKVFTMPTKQ